MAKRPGKTRASDASTPERTERIQFKVSTDEIAECRTGRPQSVNCCAAD